MNKQNTRQSSSILVALSLCMALQMAGFVMILTLFACRFESFGSGVETLGMSVMTYTLTSIIAAPFIGILANRFGRKPMLVFGLALFSAQFIGLVIFRETTLIIVSFILSGLGNATFDPSLIAYILDITLPEHKVRIMGLKGTFCSLGNLLGPALVLLFTPFVVPQVVFLNSAGLVWMLVFTSGLGLRTPQLPDTARLKSQPAVIQHKWKGPQPCQIS